MKSLINFALIASLSNLVFPVLAQVSQRNVSADRTAPGQRYFSPFKPKRNPEQQERLEPALSDRIQYAKFLRNKKTGLIRLFPDRDCEKPFVLKIDDNCVNNIPG